MDVPRPLRVCYLVNQYPKISHAFIRREILAVEACGVYINRISIRPCPDALVDPGNLAELKRTRVILDEGIFRLVTALALVAFQRPGSLWQALLLAMRLGRRSDRGLWRHLAYLAEACVLWRWLTVAPVDHVHAHFATNSAAVAMLCRELGGPPYSFSVHGPEEFERAPWLGLEEKIGRAAFVRTVSAYGRGCMSL